MIRWLRLLLLRILPSPILRIVEGFWSAPLAISLLGVLLAVVIQALPEEQVSPILRDHLSVIDKDGALNALSVIAGGMISLVALVFSLTFVALSITAQQLSPRILDFVLRERSAQVLLGLALTTFLFDAIILTAGEVRGAWRLGLATPIALGLAASTLVMVVLFAHSMTRVMRAEDMVARLGKRLVDEICELLKPPMGCSEATDDIEALERKFVKGAAICVRNAGYVGDIDYARLVQIARKRNLRIEILVRESDFLLPGSSIARVLGQNDENMALAPDIEFALNLTDRRDVSDTAGYEAAALCETALRALSPGINDPATAISCLNRLFEGLATIAAAEHPPPRLLGAATEDNEPVALILRPPRGVPEFIANTVNPILEAARNDRRVLARIEELASQLLARSNRALDRAATGQLLESVKEARQR